MRRLPATITATRPTSSAAACRNSCPSCSRAPAARDWIDRGYRLNERELRLKVRGEDLHWLTLTLLGVVEDGKLVRLWGARRNVTDRKRYQSLLEHLAFRDPSRACSTASGWWPRSTKTLSNPAIAATIRPPHCCCLISTSSRTSTTPPSHSAGDEVLRQMKDRFDEALTNEDAIAARLGGDDSASSSAVSAPPRAPCGSPRQSPMRWRNPRDWRWQVPRVRQHRGLRFIRHGRTFSDLSRAADEAMYHAKQTGGGVRLFSRSTVVFEKRKLLLLAGLPGRSTAASWCWNSSHHQLPHPQAGAPGSIGALESPGIRPPDRARLCAPRRDVGLDPGADALVDNALAAARDWQVPAPGVGVAINISPRLLGDSIIVAHLQKSIRKYGLPARLVDLEITETSLIHNSDRAAQILADCRAQGFSIIIDDYGVGFCSLATCAGYR